MAHMHYGMYHYGKENAQSSIGQINIKQRYKQQPDWPIKRWVKETIGL